MSRRISIRSPDDAIQSLELKGHSLLSQLERSDHHTRLESRDTMESEGGTTCALAVQLTHDSKNKVMLQIEE